MKKTVISLILIVIAVASALATSYAYLILNNSPEQELPSTTETSTINSPSSSSDAPGQENNSTIPSTSQSSPSLPATSSESQASSTPSSTAPTQTETQAPTPAPDSAYPEGMAAWKPYGSLVMLSPSNQTFTTNNVALTVSGGIVINVQPSLSYSIDGGPRTPITVELTNVTMAQKSISGSITLTQLANGSHVIVLYGDLGFDSRRGKITVCFEVQAA